MAIAIPFFGKKTRSPATPRAADAPPSRQKAPGEKLPLNPRRFRVFVRPAPTTYQRLLAAHMYFAERKSALD
jgi:hypothetical protein